MGPVHLPDLTIPDPDQGLTALGLDQGRMIPNPDPNLPIWIPDRPCPNRDRGRYPDQDPILPSQDRDLDLIQGQGLIPDQGPDQDPGLTRDRDLGRTRGRDQDLIPPGRDPPDQDLILPGRDPNRWRMIPDPDLVGRVLHHPPRLLQQLWRRNSRLLCKVVSPLQPKKSNSKRQ